MECQLTQAGLQTALRSIKTLRIDMAVSKGDLLVGNGAAFQNTGWCYHITGYDIFQSDGDSCYLLTDSLSLNVKYWYSCILLT